MKSIALARKASQTTAIGRSQVEIGCHLLQCQSLGVQVIHLASIRLAGGVRRMRTSLCLPKPALRQAVQRSRHSARAAVRDCLNHDVLGSPMTFHPACDFMEERIGTAVRATGQPPLHPIEAPHKREINGAGTSLTLYRAENHPGNMNLSALYGAGAIRARPLVWF
jgi:hypothetical protein